MCVVERPATRPALKRCGRCGGALTLMTRAEALTSSRGQGLFRSRLGVIGGVRKGLPSLTIVPVVYILPDLILLITVPLLNFTFELISSTVDRGQVVIREFAPLFFDLALDLLPISFNPIPIHACSPAI